MFLECRLSILIVSVDDKFLVTTKTTSEWLFNDAGQISLSNVLG